jgi:hypothetical protein
VSFSDGKLVDIEHASRTSLCHSANGVNIIVAISLKKIHMTVPQHHHGVASKLFWITLSFQSEVEQAQAVNASSACICNER